MIKSHKDTLAFIIAYQEEHEHAPCLKEIVDAVTALNWRSSARYVLQSLKKRGKIVECKPPCYKHRYVATQEET